MKKIIAIFFLTLILKGGTKIYLPDSAEITVKQENNQIWIYLNNEKFLNYDDVEGIDSSNIKKD